MRYKTVVEGRFVNRPNRFIAEVLIDGERHTVHVKNTGRCKELLLPHSRVWLCMSDNPQRKTKYDLIAVEKKREGRLSLLVNMDSQIPNDVVAEWLRGSFLFSNDARVVREVTYGNSRFDIYVEDGERKAFVEVKGVTLEMDGVAMFPDAPTERGVKHINELVRCVEDGYEAYVIFVIQMQEMKAFRPNDLTHKAFGDALRQAEASGVRVIAVDCKVTADTVEIDKQIPVSL